MIEESFKKPQREVEKHTGFFESFDGTRIYYEVRGQGKPIFMCYGIACLINHWNHQLKYFSPHYQTVILDYRGHGQTPVPENRDNVSLGAICRDIKGLAEHLNIKSACFFGHSYGVPILLKAYEMYPSLVKSMVFVNGFATNPLKGMFGVDFVPKVFEIFKESYKSYPSFTSKFWKFGVQNPLAVHLSALAGGFNLGLINFKDIEVYARGVANLDLEAFIRLFEEMMHFDGRPILKTINKPVLVIAGSKDGVTPMSHQIKMHKSIKGSQFLRVPYGSHCTQLDVPEFVNLRIEKFLKELNYI